MHMLGYCDKRDVGNILRDDYGLRLPRELRAEFSEIVRRHAAAGGLEVPAERIRDLFDEEYLVRDLLAALLVRCTMRRATCSLADPWMGLYMIRQSVRDPEADLSAAFANTLTGMGVLVSVLDKYSHVVENSTETAVYLLCQAGAQVWGVGVACEPATAALKAVLSAVNRADRITGGILRPSGCEPVFSALRSLPRRRLP